MQAESWNGRYSGDQSASECAGWLQSTRMTRMAARHGIGALRRGRQRDSVAPDIPSGGMGVVTRHRRPGAHGQCRP